MLEEKTKRLEARKGGTASWRSQSANSKKEDLARVTILTSLLDSGCGGVGSCEALELEAQWQAFERRIAREADQTNTGRCKQQLLAFASIPFPLRFSQLLTITTCNPSPEELVRIKRRLKTMSLRWHPDRWVRRLAEHGFKTTSSRDSCAVGEHALTEEQKILQGVTNVFHLVTSLKHVFGV